MSHSYNETFIDEFFAIFVALALLAIWLRVADVWASLRVPARLNSALARFTTPGRVSVRSSDGFGGVALPARRQKKRGRDLPTLPGGSRPEFFEVPEFCWDIERAPANTDAQSQRKTDQ